MGERLTKHDVEKIEKEIEYRKLVVRKDAIEAVKEARAQGDLSENFEYYAAKKEKNQNESRIRYLERMLKTAVVISEESKEDEVGLNNTVTLYMEDDDEEEIYRLVTSIRGNSLSGLISTESPIGKAILGHKVGDRVEIKVSDDFSYYVVIRKIDKTESEADDKMHLEERIKNGMTFYEHGHTDPIDIEQEKELEAQRRHCKEVMFDYNNTRPSENVKKKEILKGILGHCTDRVFIESPVHMSYGNHVHLGDQFYANFNLVVIDDMDVYIGKQVMIGPNVTICTTGHPVYPLYREMGAHYSLPIHVGNKVWIGANSVVLPGVTIGENSVIGAGSIVTRDIPANVVAVGNPYRVIREITERDREYYFRDMKVDFPYTLREEG